MEPTETKPTPEQIERLVGHLLLNPDLRQDFLNDPAGVAEQLNVHLTQEQVDHIGLLDHTELNGYADEIYEEIGPSQIASWIRREDQGARIQ